MIKRVSLILLASLMLIISACSNNEADNNEESLIIKTTLYPLEYIVDQIGGEAIQVETIYPPGVDAHTYEPTSKEITELAKADAFIYLGAGMEGFANKAASALEDQSVRLIEVGANESLFAQTETSHDGHQHEDDHSHSDMDPHIWLDPLKMNDIADMLILELNELAPDHETEFNANLKTFKEEMIHLDESFARTLDTNNHKPILVSHAAYGYWERKYGIEQLSISGLSTSDEPSQKQLAEMARLAKEYKINYVLYGQNESNQTAEIIQNHINAKKLHLHDLEVLTEEDITDNADYLSIMEDNLATLKKAIQ